MTSIEIVRRALHFQNPPRLPVSFSALGVSDFGNAGFVFPKEKQMHPAVDQWGCRWERTDMKNMGQVKGHPITDFRRIDAYPMPDYTQDWWWTETAAALPPHEEKGRYVRGGIFMVLFERMHTLCGFENVLMGLLTERPAMERLADRIVDTHVELVRQYSRRFGRRVSGISMTDDWGTQNAAFISFDLWMDFFAPRYKRLFDAMHGAGYDVFLHSCGKVNELIEGFIRVGVDAVDLQQPRALGIEEVGRRYRGRICFHSLADIQATLPTGRADLIAADADALAEHWMNPRGGFIFADYGDGEAIGAPLPAKLRMYQEFSRVSERIYGQPLPPLPPPG